MNQEVEKKYQLLESFVYQVGQYLPEGQREEISCDLKQSIYEEIESVAEREGRQVSEDDLLAVIGAFGHPLKVASAYLPQRYLIGPEIFPVYMRALRTFLTLAIVGQVMFGLLMFFLDDWRMSPWQLFGMSLELLVWITVVITAVCIAIEYGGEKLNWYEKWQPTDLARNAVGPIDRSDVFTNILSEGFFLLWWNDVLVLQNFMPDSVIRLQLSTGWDPYWLPLNILFGLSFCIHAYVLLIGHWRRFAMITEIVLFAAMVGLGLILLTIDPLVVLSGDMGEEKISANFVDGVLRTIVGVVVLFTMWDIFKGLKMWRGGYDAGLGSTSTHG